jgi:hypothetical protein
VNPDPDAADDDVVTVELIAVDHQHTDEVGDPLGPDDAPALQNFLRLRLLALYFLLHLGGIRCADPDMLERFFEFPVAAGLRSARSPPLPSRWQRRHSLSWEALSFIYIS